MHFRRVVRLVLVLFAIPKDGVGIPPRSSELYFKVASAFSMENLDTNFCLIRSEIKMSSLQSECSSRCGRIERCYLTCFNESVCMFYDSFISKYWDPLASDPERLQLLSGFHCYSSYHIKGDITSKVVKFRGRENSPYVIKSALDGYYCVEVGMGYASPTMDHPWIELEFDVNYSIREVIVFTRKHAQPSRFKTVEVRVGPNPGIEGNFSGQTFFDYYEGMAKLGEVVTFRSKVPVRGKFLSLKVVSDYNSLLIHEIKVLV